MIWDCRSLTTGMRLRHLSVATFLRHALTTIVLDRSHRSDGQHTRHNRRRKKNKRHNRHDDFAKWLHGLKESIGSLAWRCNTSRELPIISELSMRAVPAFFRGVATHGIRQEIIT